MALSSVPNPLDISAKICYRRSSDNPRKGDRAAYEHHCVIGYSPNLTATLDDFDVEMEDSSIREYWEGVEIHRVLLETGEFAEDTFTITVRAK